MTRDYYVYDAAINKAWDDIEKLGPAKESIALRIFQR